MTEDFNEDVDIQDVPERLRDDLGSFDGGEKGGKVFAPKKNEDRNSAYEPKPSNWKCPHNRFTRIDKIKTRESIQIMQQCRRCGLHRVFVTTRNFNSRNVYADTRYYDLAPVPRNESNRG